MMGMKKIDVAAIKIGTARLMSIGCSRLSSRYRA